ncbi:Glycine-zipper containing OmpA-like membrane domain [Balamuthia mandrillaris]
MYTSTSAHRKERWKVGAKGAAEGALIGGAAGAGTGALIGALGGPIGVAVGFAAGGIVGSVAGAPNGAALELDRQMPVYCYSEDHNDHHLHDGSAGAGWMRRQSRRLEYGWKKRQTKRRGKKMRSQNKNGYVAPDAVMDGWQDEGDPLLLGAEDDEEEFVDSGLGMKKDINNKNYKKVDYLFAPTEQEEY